MRRVIVFSYFKHGKSKLKTGIGKLFLKKIQESLSKIVFKENLKLKG